MFTVLLLSDAAKPTFQNAEEYFEPFQEAGELAFCAWDQSLGARSLSEAVPDLSEIIRGKEAWRAIVVDHAADLGDAGASRDPENPFDYLDSRSTRLDLDSSSHAPVRLAHMLLGYPDLGAKTFEPAVRFTPEGSHDAEELSLSELGDHPEFAGLSPEDAIEVLRQRHSDVMVHFREVDYDAEDRRRHRELRTQYEMKEVRPSEVVFITTRAPVEPDSKAMLLRAWRTEPEQSAARFVDRNDYPAGTRFAVFDLVGPENSGYEHGLLRFWLSVLTMAVNSLHGSAFQGDKVYRIDVELSTEALGTRLNHQISRLTSVREHVDSMIQQPDAPPSTDVAELLQPKRVQVAFGALGGEDLAAPTDGYGLASDMPRREAIRWREDATHVALKADTFIRKPRRVLARAVFDARAKADAPRTAVHSLTDLEREELEEGLATRMQLLVRPATTKILDRQRLNNTMAHHDAEVSDHIDERMPTRTIVTAGVVVLAVWTGALVPYVMQAAGVSSLTLGGSALVVALSLALVSATAIVTLVMMRRQLLIRIHAFNRAMRVFVAEVNGGASAFGDYLSGVATYMYARSVMLDATHEGDRRRQRLRRLKGLRARLDQSITRKKALVSSLGAKLEVQRLTTGFADLDLNSDADVQGLFRFPTSLGAAGFNASGESVAVPYDFVTRLTVERVALYDQAANRAGVSQS